MLDDVSQARADARRLAVLNQSTRVEPDTRKTKNGSADITNWEEIDAFLEQAHQSRAELEAVKILKDAFSFYATAHADQMRIVANGSFVQTLKTAIARCAAPPYLWFNDAQLRKIDAADDPIILTSKQGALQEILVQAHDWMTIEDDLGGEHAGTDLFFPGRIMSSLPTVCHEAGIKLRGIKVDWLQ